MMFAVIAEALKVLADAVPGAYGERVHQLAARLLADTLEVLTGQERPVPTAPAGSADPDQWVSGWKLGYATGYADARSVPDVPRETEGPVPAEPGAGPDGSPPPVTGPTP